jgi:DNA polymerase-3 subunit alpha
MNRLKGDVINKRQLEKLIQSGSFDSLYKNRSKLFINVPNFVEIYGGIHNKNENQTFLFEVEKLSFEDRNIFNQDIIEWSSSDLLKNELEVLGFYFSNHPLSLYPKNYFVKNNIIDFDDIIADKNIVHSKVVGAILDIKERSNKEGKKYAFLTISNSKTQFELSIFNDKLSEFRHLIKEGNVLIFYINISRDNENIRMVIRKIEDLDKEFSNQRQKYSVFLSDISDSKLIDSLLKNSDKNLNELFIFYNKNNKLISLDFSKNYEISNYSYLDRLNNAKKIDYSIDFL